MRVLVAGSSGFLGTHLVTTLRSGGHDVRRLVRRPAAAGDESTWDPESGTLDRSEVERADVVVNLAGSPTAGNPHSRRWADNLRHSRVTTTRVLAETIAAVRADAGTGPAFVAGNAIGWYGDHGDEIVTEASDSRGDSLLARVTRDWQAATRPAEDAGSRVCVVRTAPVMDLDSQPLGAMRWPFRLGLGTRIGSGAQYFPMVSLRDWVAAAVRLVEDPALHGPVNVCAPVTPTNAEFTEALARQLGRRALLAVPAPVIRLATGKLSPELLGSVRAEPRVLLDVGHEFRDQNVTDVLHAGLHRARLTG